MLLQIIGGNCRLNRFLSWPLCLTTFVKAVLSYLALCVVNQVYSAWCSFNLTPKRCYSAQNYAEGVSNFSPNYAEGVG